MPLKWKEQRAQTVSTNIAVESGDDVEPSTMQTDHNTGAQPEDTSRIQLERRFVFGVRHTKGKRVHDGG